ncbi:Oidioi.mRNA.OKI2018_I69.PAR.g11535.t1.cds [Oikopleura dioica]|uniref:Oidioi.mRNA.OKI2018_I69.PAR.g11535.t1.cds n=1 Tax=Oikopleura dioica TaxID=34765 RepID=A0ABN7S2Y3_OIKDI|nr:Oidioi.mRNA.OKI2018_I69.PAR.g11535.t1.cds [Oikopleura dioica]
MRPGSYRFCYCDTDSLMLALDSKKLDDCVAEKYKSEWISKIKPAWFAKTECPISEKTPGLLKVEGSLSAGWYLACTPKCYLMAKTTHLDEMERKILRFAKKYSNGVYSEQRDSDAKEILADMTLLERSQGSKTPYNIVKKSSKGCNLDIKLSLYAYMWSVFGCDMRNRLEKPITSFQMDRKRNRMKTTTMQKRIMNPLLKKRHVCDDRISTLPLFNSVTNQFL